MISVYNKDNMQEVRNLWHVCLSCVTVIMAETLGVGPDCTVAKSCWIFEMSKKKKGVDIWQSKEHKITTSTNQNSSTATAAKQNSRHQMTSKWGFHLIWFSYSDFKKDIQITASEKRHHTP